MIAIGVIPAWGNTKKTAYTKGVERKQAPVLALFHAREWQELEALLDAELETPKFDERGVSYLKLYSFAFSIYEYEHQAGPEDKWEGYLTMLADWKETIPDSEHIAPAMIRYWTSYAWDARGNGYAHTVTREGGNLFVDRLKQAERIFKEETKDGVNANPMLYCASSNLGLGQCWDLEDYYERVIMPVIKHYPEHYDLLRGKYRPYLPQWQGELTSEAEYFAQVAQDLPKEYGELFYARVFLDRFVAAHNSYHEEYVDEEMIKRGALRWIQKSKDKYFIIQTLLFFSKHGEPNEQYTLYRQLMELYPERMAAIQKKDKYLKGIALAQRCQPELMTRVAQYRPTAVNYGGRYVRDIVFSQSTGMMICSIGYDGVQMVNKRDGKTYDTAKKSQYWVSELDVSASGRYVMGAWYSEDQKDRSFRVSIYDVSGKELREVAVTDDLPGWIRELSFGPSDSKVAISVYDYTKKEYVLYHWDWEADLVKKKYTRKGAYKGAELKYNVHRDELALMDMGISFYKWDEEKPQFVYVDHPDVQGKKFIHAQFFDEGRYLMAVQYHKKLGKYLYIIDTETKTLHQKVELSAAKNYDAPYLFQVRTMPTENTWEVVAVGGKDGLGTWELKKKGGKFSAQLLSYNVTDQYPVFSLNSDGTHDSPIYLGDKKGLISVWQRTEYVQEAKPKRGAAIMD